MWMYTSVYTHMYLHIMGPYASADLLQIYIHACICKHLVIGALEEPAEVELEFALKPTAPLVARDL